MLTGEAEAALVRFYDALAAELAAELSPPVAVEAELVDPRDEDALLASLAAEDVHLAAYIAEQDRLFDRLARSFPDLSELWP